MLRFLQIFLSENVNCKAVLHLSRVLLPNLNLYSKHLLSTHLLSNISWVITYSTLPIKPTLPQPQDVHQKAQLQDHQACSQLAISLQVSVPECPKILSRLFGKVYIKITYSFCLLFLKEMCYENKLDNLGEAL